MGSREGRKCLLFGRRRRRKVKAKCVRFEIKNKNTLVVLERASTAYLPNRKPLRTDGE